MSLELRERVVACGFKRSVAALGCGTFRGERSERDPLVRPQKSDRQSGCEAARRGPVLGADRRAEGADPALVDEQDDMTLAGCRHIWRSGDIASASGRCGASLAAMALLGKRTARAAERLDILKRRRDGFVSQPDLDPQRLVFIDET
ncbi:hypothetical protein [Bosea rubneri]|uniref:Transposase n=1 Tax=Bosea rubneri TaxID=3075434 RepID=A0ABU3SE69_9HYPH|nr:hypothetical protein [Bosea sp. ZW T0_25]MDU0342986.1 hypothetical protein [Bosea sp. ZW T0_25]